MAQQGLALAHDLAAVPHCDEHTGNPHVGTRTTQAADLSAHALEAVKDKTVDLRGDNHLVTGKQRVDARHGIPRGTIEDAVVRAVVILRRADEIIQNTRAPHTLVQRVAVDVIELRGCGDKQHRRRERDGGIAPERLRHAKQKRCNVAVRVGVVTRLVKVRQIALSVAVDQQHALSVVMHEDLCEVDGGDGLADAAFVVHDRNGFHVVLLFLSFKI